MNPRSAASRVLRYNGAVMGFHNGAHDGQSHPQAFAFRGEERLEESLACFIRNTNAVIADAHSDHFVTTVLRFHQYFAVLNRRIAHSIESIDNQIDEDLLNLDRIRFDRQQIWLQRSAYLARMKQGIGTYH